MWKSRKIQGAPPNNDNDLIEVLEALDIYLSSCDIRKN